MKHNKKHSTPAPSKPWRKTLQIPAIPYPSEDQFQKQGTKTVSSPQRPSSLASSPEPREQNIASELAVIATNIWRTRKKMVDEKSGEPREEMRRVYHHIQAVLDTFHKMALEIRDHTGEAFDYGSPLAVITTQPTPGLKREQVIETIRPTIYWKHQIIQQGEVVIATPAPAQGSSV